MSEEDMEHGRKNRKRFVTGSSEESSPAEGESTGPHSKDLYIARYRSGGVPLAPIQPPAPAMLNFATALF